MIQPENNISSLPANPAIGQVLQLVMQRRNHNRDIAANREAMNSYLKNISNQRKVFDTYFNDAMGPNGVQGHRLAKAYKDSYGKGGSYNPFGKLDKDEVKNAGNISVTDDIIKPIAGTAAPIAMMGLINRHPKGKYIVTPELNFKFGRKTNKALRRGLGKAGLALEKLGLKGGAGKTAARLALKVENPLLWATIAGNLVDEKWELYNKDGTVHQTLGNWLKKKSGNFIYSWLKDDDDSWLTDTIKHAVSFTPRLLTDFLFVPMSLIEKGYLDTFKGYDKPNHQTYDQIDRSRPATQDNLQRSQNY